MDQGSEIDGNSQYQLELELLHDEPSRQQAQKGVFVPAFSSNQRPGKTERSDMSNHTKFSPKYRMTCCLVRLAQNYGRISIKKGSFGI